MVSISHETPDQTDQRLRSVTRAATLDVLDGAFGFATFGADRFAQEAVPDALALIRDGDLWSQLVRVGPEFGGEQFFVFSFHFAEATDNSGFVGWLATHLKRRLGTGVFVVCGYNPDAGGVFDYWGAPWALREAVLSELSALRGD